MLKVMNNSVQLQFTKSTNKKPVVFLYTENKPSKTNKQTNKLTHVQQHQRNKRVRDKFNQKDQTCVQKNTHTYYGTGTKTDTQMNGIEYRAQK